MLAVAIILAGAWVGVGAVRRLGWSLSRFEAIALASAVALTTTPWILFLTSWTFGFAIGLPLGVALLAVGGQLLGRGRRVCLEVTTGPSMLSWAVLGAMFALLFHGHMLHAEGGGLFTGGSSYGDLALHATLATRFAVDEIGFTSPLAAGEPLTYPFLGDFLVGCLIRGGCSISTAFALTGWLSVMTGLALLDALARRMFGRRAAGTIAVWLMVLSGALIGLWYAAGDLLDRGLPTSPGELPSYANQWGRGVTWSNMVCDFFLPQRALLAAFPAVAAAVWLMRAALEEATGEAARRRLFALIALLIGTLPFLHVHSFLVTLGLLVTTAVIASVRARRPLVAPWAACAGAIALAVPQLAWQLGQSWSAGFGHWSLGWRAPSGQFWSYWVKNWGLPLLISPAVALSAWRHGRTSFAVVLVLGGLGLFLAGNLYQFQPHDWDNMKFFVYAHVALAVVLGGMLSAWLASTWPRRLAASVAIVAMTGTGALTLIRELDRHDQLASTADLRLARELRETLPPDARVLTSDQHNHVVPMLTGRGVVMGYRGWLWTHGIDYRWLEADVATMFAGGLPAEAGFRRRGVTHVYIGPGEERDWRANRDWYRERYPIVATGDGIEVFDVRESRGDRRRPRVTVVAPGDAP